MIKKILVVLLLVTLAGCRQVPPPGTNPATELFPLAFSGTAWGLAQHSTGVYVVGAAYGDAFIRKYDSGGTVLWGKQFGVQNSATAVGVASDGSDNAYVVGQTRGSDELYDLFLRKYTPGGRVAWTRQVSRDGYSHQAGGVAVYGDSIYVAWSSYEDYGDSEGGIGTTIYGFVRKYDESGRVVWTRRIGTRTENVLDADVPKDVAVDGSGNVYVVGSTNGSLAGTNGGGSDMFIRKYSPAGRVLWTRQHHYSDYDYADNLAVSGSNVYLVGRFLKSSDWDAGWRVRIAKYTTSGSLGWNKSYGTYGTNLQVSDASADSKGNLYVSGSASTSSDHYMSVIKLNASGGYMWKRLFDTFDPNAVLARTDAQVYVGGPGLMRIRGSDGSTVWNDL